MNWTGYFPIATSNVTIPLEPDCQTCLDIEAARKTERLYQKRGRKVFRPLTDWTSEKERGK